MENLFEKRFDADLISLLKLNNSKRYKVLNEGGTIKEAWELNDNEWVDVTQREKLKETIAKEKEELEKLAKKELKEQNEDNK